MGNTRGWSQRAFALQVALVALSLGGCGFGGGSGAGSTDTDDDGSEGTDGTGGTSNTSPTTPGTTSPVTTDSTGTGPTTTPTGEPETTASDSGIDDDTNATCDPFSAFYWAADLPAEDRTLGERDASLLPPFEGEPIAFLHGEEEQQGFAHFRFDVPCGGDVTLWALAWDAEASSVDNADSFFFTLDAEETTDQDAVWEYGCEAPGQGRTWSWYRVRDTGEACGDGGTWMALEGGEHSFRILHREEVSFAPIDFNFAGIAALVVTNDPSYDPLDDYNPDP